MARTRARSRRTHPLLAAGLAAAIALASSATKAPVAHAASTTATTELTVECRDQGARGAQAPEPAQIRRTERGRIPATADATAAGIDAALLVALTTLIVGVASRDGPHEGEEDAMSTAKD